jgi:hypothetical protein
LDNTVLHNGHVSIRLDPPLASSPGKSREVNLKWIPVKPGDHIVFKAWMKVDAVPGYKFNIYDPNTWRGARIGFEYYDDGGIVTGVSGPYGTIPQPVEDTIANWVLWGTTGWVQRTIEVVVPNTVPRYVTNEPEVPQGIIAWFQVLGYPNDSPSSLGSGWIADAELYINP